MPSDRGTVLEMADPGAMQGDVRRLPHRRFEVVASGYRFLDQFAKIIHAGLLSDFCSKSILLGILLFRRPARPLGVLG